MNWKYSAAGVKSLALAISELPGASEMLALMTPATREALERPHTQAWHDGEVVLDSARAVERIGGLKTVEEMSYLAVKRSLGPRMEPFLRVSLALFGMSPATVYRRMNDTMKTVMQNVSTEWTAEGEHRGRLVITHPDDVPEVSWASWKGSLRYTFDLCGVTGGTLGERRDLATPRTLVFDCAWRPS